MTSAIALTLLAAALGSTALRAQPTTLSLPPGIILPNYERVPIGQREGIEGGAFVARTDDAVANWYNPAGLVSSEASALNASATTYEWMSVTLEGLERSAARSRISAVGTLIAAVLGAPVITSDRWRFGFSVSRPLAWRPSGIDEALAIEASAGSDAERLGYAGEVDFSSIMPAIAVGYAPDGRERGTVRVGAGFGVSVTGLSQTQVISAQVITDSTAQIATRRFSAEASVWHAVLTGGVQWDVSSRVSLGARIVAPGIRLTGSSRLSFQQINASESNVSQLTFRDTEGDFDYRIPLEIDAGVAVRWSRGEIELDVRYHGSVSAYELYASDSVARFVEDAAGTAPVQAEVPFAATVNSTRRVTNFAIGGSYLVGRGLRVHAGFATDESPVESQATSAFRKVDLYRVTTGVSLTGGRLSGSLGLGYSSGAGSRESLQATPGGSTVSTRLEVQSLNLLYALSFAF
jgi:hypothetical protein